MEAQLSSAALVPLDGSRMAEDALPYAQALVPNGEAIVLVRVLPEIEPLLGELAWTLDSTPEDFAAAEGDAARALLRMVVTRVSDPHHRWDTQVVLGDPAKQILQAIQQRQIGTVVMTTHGRGAVGRAVFGSVADRVASASPVPVLLVRPHGTAEEPPSPPVQRLVVPLDGSQLAEMALPLAIELARRHAIAVHLVRAVDHVAFLAFENGGSALTASPPSELFQELVEKITGDACDYLASVTARVENEGVKATWTVLKGSPFFVIADSSERGDLIVMTSHGRGGALRWLQGSVAEKLVREAPVPVLLVPSPDRGLASSTS
jgi:nucleotide-binding universal stress UspA family protein